MDECQFVFAGLPSPLDDRDYLDLHLGSAPAPISIPPTFLPDVTGRPVYFQGQRSACGGHAGTKLKNIIDNLLAVLNPRFVYALCLKLLGFSPDSGVTARSIMQVLQKYGVPLETPTYSNAVTLPAAQYANVSAIPQSVYVDALTRRIGPYTRITDLSMDGLKAAIYTCKAVLILKAPWVPGKYPGGHFVVLDGYGTDVLRFSNSFGPDWQDHGEGVLTAADIPTVIEAWTAVDLPSQPVQPVLPQPPAPPANPSSPQVNSWLDALKQWLRSVLQKVAIPLGSTSMESTSKSFSIDGVDLYKVATGFLVGLSGAAITVFTMLAGATYHVAISGTDMTPIATVIVSTVFSALVNLLRKYVSENSAQPQQ